ncbi:hypothetical protein KKE68_05905, partial [Patescibacteria group bacterium]|nr:hypothetical protein [Patescibacteria group bacterium]
MLKIKRYKKIIKAPKYLSKYFFRKKIFLALILISMMAIITITTFYYYFLKDLPSPTKLSKATLSYSTQIYDRSGQLLYTIYANRNQTFVPLDIMPKTLSQATIAI